MIDSSSNYGTNLNNNLKSIFENSKSIENLNFSLKGLSIFKFPNNETETEESSYNKKQLLENTFSRKTILDGTIDEMLETLKKCKISNFNYSTMNFINRYINPDQIDLGNYHYLLFERDVSKDENYSIPFDSENRHIAVYSECDEKYHESLSHSKSFLETTPVSAEYCNHVTETASKVVKPFLHEIAKYDLILILFLIIGFCVSIGLGFILGIYFSYYFFFCSEGLYFVIGFLTICLIKKRNIRYNFYAHLSLSLYLRSENLSQDIYNSILLRPGPFGKWIEFIKVLKI